MKIIDLEKLKVEMERKNDVLEAYQSLADFPSIISIMRSESPISIRKLEDLKKQIHDLLLDLYTLCNGYINQDTELVFQYEPDPESENPEDLIPLLMTTGPETLGSWKSRLKKMRDQLHFDSEAQSIITKKLDELYELKSL